MGSADYNFRVCSWNTAYFFKWGEADGVQRLADARCDAILLQEVWKPETLQSNFQHIQSKYFPEMEVFSYGEFTFLAKRTDLVGGSLEAYDTTGFVVLNIVRGGRNVALFNVHLWTPLSHRPYYSRSGKMEFESAQQARQLQRESLLHVLSELPSDTSVIVAGDFNTMQNGSILRNIQKIDNRRLSLLSLPLGESRNTFPTSRPLLQLDYAFVETSFANSAKLTTSCTYSASDHCLLIIDVVL